VTLSFVINEAPNCNFELEDGFLVGRFPSDYLDRKSVRYAKQVACLLRVSADRFRATGEKMFAPHGIFASGSRFLDFHVNFACIAASRFCCLAPGNELV
jgi:hypothetical protein